MRMLTTIMRSPNSVRALFIGALVIIAGGAGASTAAAGTGDIVLHARSATTRGAWSLVNDTTAADGVRLSNPDAGEAKLANALASPANYFEMTFTPEAGRAYHLWIRGKAQNNSWTNDSVFVQFSGSTSASGSALYRIGTTSATVYSLEEDSGVGESAGAGRTTATASACSVTTSTSAALSRRSACRCAKTACRSIRSCSRR